MKANEEIRKILMGKTVLTEEGKLTTRSKGQFSLPQGVRNGSGAVRLFGVSKRQRSYRLTKKLSDKQIEQLLAHMGRGVVLAQTPQVYACLRQYAMTDPVLLQAQAIGQTLQVSAFTARTPWAALLCRSTLNTLEKLLPEGTERIKDEPQNKAVDGDKASKKETKKPDNTHP